MHAHIHLYIHIPSGKRESLVPLGHTEHNGHWPGSVWAYETIMVLSATGLGVEILLVDDI